MWTAHGCYGEPVCYGFVLHRGAKEGGGGRGVREGEKRGGQEVEGVRGRGKMERGRVDDSGCHLLVTCIGSRF